jgi:hypothetical protein
MDNWELSMLTADVVVAGGGISGLLIASALAGECSVILLEQNSALPNNKYWLTDSQCVANKPGLCECVDRQYDSLDFIACDGLTATLTGRFYLWDTEKLIAQLEHRLSVAGVKILTGHRLYAISYSKEAICIRANSQLIKAKLLIDCMGFGSPIVGAKDIANLSGYFILHGCEVQLKHDIRPVGLDNLLLDKTPTYFELFPTSKGTAHAAIILPSRHYTPNRSLKGDLNFILGKSHYSEHIVWPPANSSKSYFGIIPVGRLHRPTLDRIIFFGEAGQANPATSATALTRMFYVYKDLARNILRCLQANRLHQDALAQAVPQYMSPMNRWLQEDIFKRLLSFNSDKFRELIEEMKRYPNDSLYDLMFANFDFQTFEALRLFVRSFSRGRRVLSSSFSKAFFHYLSLKK